MLSNQVKYWDYTVSFFWDQPLQSQPVWVGTVDVSQQNTFLTVFGRDAVPWEWLLRELQLRWHNLANWFFNRYNLVSDRLKKLTNQTKRSKFLQHKKLIQPELADLNRTRSKSG